MEDHKKKYGALKVSLEKNLASFLISESEFAYISLKVSGYDIPSGHGQRLNFIPLKDESSVSEIIIEKIPAGTDRIITLQVYDEKKEKYPGILFRGVCNICEGENSLQLSESTTAFGNVLYGIKDIYNFEELEKDGRMKAILNVIDDSVPPVLFDSAKLIGELQGFSFPWNATKADYKLEPGTVDFNYILSENFTVSINDPLSEKLSGQKPTCGLRISGVAPGNWSIRIFSENGKLLEQNEVSVKSGENVNLGYIEHDGIAVLCGNNAENSRDGRKILKFWNPVFEEENKSGKNQFFEADINEKLIISNFEGGEVIPVPVSSTFCLYNFSNCSAVNLSVSEENADCASPEEFKISHKGIYLVTESGLYRLDKKKLDDKPIDHLKIMEEHFKKCFIDDPENRRFVVLFKNSYLNEKISSIKVDFNSGINDCEGSYNGKQYAMTESEKGFWYVSVPYSDVQRTNQCGQPSYNFKINGTMREPPEFVPDGYIYQKFFGSIPVQKFLVLIYSYQDEKKICRRLSQSKNCLKLKDFDLTSKEGQMKISNFRLVPGTVNLYRSYHPYRDDKVKISNTSRARMKYIARLSEEAGIKADINLSDLNQTNFTYSMPSYYQKIIDNDAVLYMTDCSYSVCYEKTSSDEFRTGIEKIADFINEKEGPYQIHCAIGTDRTGIVCAVISALCGADFSEIEEDYCKSVEMGIYEYRGAGTVRYAFENLLGVQFIEDTGNLKEKLLLKLSRNDENYVKKIKRMIERLSS